MIFKVPAPAGKKRSAVGTPAVTSLFVETLRRACLLLRYLFRVETYNSR